MNNNTDDQIYEIQKVLNKKVYKGKLYYKVQWVDYDEPSWELAKNCNCPDLVAEFEARPDKPHEDDDEWEVEMIEDKRVTKEGKVQYLIKWKNWPGKPTWEDEDKCECVNLIAAFENPKLRKMWDFRGSNQTLWVDQNFILRFMRSYLKQNILESVQILDFQPDYPLPERKLNIRSGLNIGPLKYDNHYYLVIIIKNHINVTKRILVSDPLNTLIGTNIRVHPVMKRLMGVYKNYQVMPAKMTQMARSDMCAFYVMAAFQRALFLYSSNARFVVESIYFEHKQAELVRSLTLPNADGQISPTLPIPDSFCHGPKCEFCDELFDTMQVLDKHILKAHMIKRSDESRNIIHFKSRPLAKSVAL